MTQRSLDAEPVGSRPQVPVHGRWLLVLLILCAFALRVYTLDGREFWFDEALSANISGLGWDGALTHLRSEPFEHPPLYYLSLYPWQKVTGTSEYAFRFYSVFWGVLCVPLLYALVRRLTGPRGRSVGLLAALLATLSPFLVAYSQEARMYTLAPCLAVLLLLSFQNALQEERRRAWWLVYAVLMAVGLATHYLFALIWVAFSVYFLLEWCREHRARYWGIAMQVLVLLVVMVWLIVAPGLRSSLARIWEGEAVFSLAYKLDKIIPTLILADHDGGMAPPVAHILAIGGWMLVLLGVWWSRRGQVLTVQAWRLLMLFLVIPLVASLLIPYHVLGRHLGYTLAAIVVFWALGLVALRQWGRSRLVVGALAFLLFSTYGLDVRYKHSNGDFGQAMAFIDARARQGDVVVLSQPSQYPLVTYYNTGGWPVRYVPPGTVSPTPAGVDDHLDVISQRWDRLWLGPIGAWTADPDLLVEQWLTAHAFQAEKTWFPDSSSVALYLRDDAELSTRGTTRFVWGGRIRLVSLLTSPLEVASGDALRLRFQWQAGMDLGERYAVRLSLTDDRGLSWATRHSEPCGGWCPTDQWQVGQLQEDQHALLIPPGTPPGIYHLQLAWLPLQGESALEVVENGQRVGQVTVAQVTIVRPKDGVGEPGIVPNPLQVTFNGEVTLLGYEPAAIEAQAGETLRLETHWRAETTPTDDYTLLVELLDPKRQVCITWESSPSAESYPTDLWQPGEYLRGQEVLSLPGTLSPGRYRLRIALVPTSGEQPALAGSVQRELLGGLITWQQQLEGPNVALTSVRVLDRHRRFDPPPVSQTLNITVGQQAHLLGYDLDLSQAHPTGQVHLTLYWRAGGPMVRPFKVFTHLVDDQGTIRGQHDAMPGGGCCPANTWAEGEVIVDDHPITLGAGLSPGTYYLVVGMYDEETGSRLPVYSVDGKQLPHDRVQIQAVTIQPLPASMPPVSPFDFDHVVYIPLLNRKER